MNADSIAGLEVFDLLSGLLDYTRHLMTESKWQSRNRRHTGAIMRIGMTNARGTNADENIARPDLRDLDPLLDERRTDSG